MAVAELKAFLGIDTKDYEAGMVKVTGDTRRFQTSISSAGREIQGTSKVAGGLAQVLTGGLSGGINSVIAGFNRLGGAAVEAGAKIAVAFAAYKAGFKIGTAIDKKFGLSDAFGKEFGGAGGEESLEFGDFRFRRGRRLSELAAGERAGAIREETGEMDDPTLSKSLQLKIDYDRKIAEAQKLHDAAQTQQEKDAYAERIETLRTHYRRMDAELEQAWNVEQAKRQQQLDDVIAKERAARDRERDAAVKAAKSTADAIAKERAGAEQRIAEIKARPMDARGQGIRVDSSAAVGGFVGRSRVGLEAKSKELAVISETLKRQIEIRDIAKESLKTQQEIRDRSQPNGGPQG